MATNTLRPGQAPPPRANTPRPRPELEVVPANVPTEQAAAANGAAATNAATAANATNTAAAPVAAAPAAPARAAAPRPKATPRLTPKPLTEEEAAAQAEAWQNPAATTATGWSLFSLLDRFTGLDGLFREGLPVRYLPKLLFVMALTLLYIGNTHYGNRMNRNIQRLKQETEDLRADYTTLKSDYMEASKQSEVARKVAAIGLVESSSPPFRITVPAGRLAEAELEAMPIMTSDTLTARAARDSVAAVRADAAEGRVRRQQLGLSTAEDAALEAGAPPPGLSADDSLAATKPKVISGSAAGAGRAGTHQNRANGIKKHKIKQDNSAPHTSHGAKKAASPSPAHGPATR